MVSKWTKRTGIALAALALAGLAVALGGKAAGESKLTRKIAVPVAPVALSNDPARIEQGRYLFSTRGCAECHGANGAGRTVMKEGAILVMSPNITSGANSVTTGYKVEDWVRTVRHGVKPNGNPVMIMPSEDYNRLTDEDMASLIVYIKSLPPAAGVPPVIELPTPAKVLYAFGVIKDAAEKIDHTLPPAVPVAPAVTVEHGAYVANTCMGCHGARLSGGKIPGAPPTWPATANLTPGKGSVMPRYPTPEVFMATLRSGRRPDGSAISEVMPFASLKQMNETDLRALYTFLKTLPPVEAGKR
ncbi:c-type cytochrome [Massilia sp. R2A-15]|uniref:c-type cytochrome n=1 Tax=Massilia sp. R2A-15 TaxID=3064278 RepID=UPI0027345ED1|nr:c-type cytochrome [Massilia sp. R2A-15]WLI90151.1 c-type cytochrome [Massilia sp. R2A-15]